MTLTYSGSALAANTTYLLTDIPDYQFNISITGRDNNLYTFNNASLAAGSDLSGVEVIVLSSGGFLFYNTSSYPHNSYSGSADFVNGNSILSTAPPSNLSSFPDARTDGYSLYYLAVYGGQTILAMGDYGNSITSVPEPTTLALAGLGGLGLLLFRRRK
jgi:hypothetical protein